MFALAVSANLCTGNKLGWLVGGNVFDQQLLGTLAMPLAAPSCLIACSRSMVSSLSTQITGAPPCHPLTFQTMAAGVTGLSIALRVATRQELLARRPWLANALGTVSLDCVIIFLALTLRRQSPGDARVGDDALCSASGDLERTAVQESDDDEEEASLRHPFLPAQT